MDKKRLTCAECGHKSDNLTDHIETKHASLLHGKKKGLVAYVLKHGAEEDDLVHPEWVEEEETKAVSEITKEKPVSKPVATVATGSIKIAGVDVPLSLSSGGDNVPKLIPHYNFTGWAPDIAQDIIEDKRVLALGHTGSGKTSLFEQVAARIEQSVVRVNLNGQTTVGDFVGLYTVKDGATEWVDGALPMAMRKGYWLILDEIDFAEPQILSVLNGVLEPGGKLFLKEKGHEVVEPHPNFRIFATANGIGCMSDFRALYQGVNIMNEAFLDRWRCYYVDYMKPEDEVKVIIGALPRYAKSESAAQVIVKVVNHVREAFKKEEVSCTFSTRRTLEWADLMLRYKDPIKAAEIAIFSKVNKTDADVVRGIIQRIMTSKR